MYLVVEREYIAQPERTGSKKRFFSRSESIGPRDANREPNKTQKEVEHYQAHGELEDCRIPTG